MKKKKFKIWLSSTDLSDRDFGQIISILPSYEVIFNLQLIKDAGSSFSLEDHLKKLEECQLFLGLINPKMSENISGVENIPLREIERARELEIPYWYVVHRDVTFTRHLLNDLVLKGGVVQSTNKNVFDIRTIDIYDEIRSKSIGKENHQKLTDFFRLSTFLDEINKSLLDGKKSKKVQKLMLASTVYGFEDQLSKIIMDLGQHNFDILNSFYGSLKVNPKLSNLENCVNSVKEADIFLGIVRSYYGTGNIRNKDAVDVEDKNITFEEIRKAIDLEKQRWFYVHRDVDFCWKVLEHIEVKATFEEKQKGKTTNKNTLRPNAFIYPKTIELYNFVIKDHETNVALRNGNWAQEFLVMSEALRYIQTQLKDLEFIESLTNGGRNGR
ncbi:DUF4062 domain-containing protein [Aquiflexum sp. LQ15W]|uniref:DUF4062 domain-containing protein n=1 Tax=Cognataquiflexum nitidum TaxID=2922272 RepID=UPI001F141A49|nr:DUF4062 domain-containing protein [Cognataquiflexum nitidum]MCH6198624.1 DUF4062 domain-containing protein [Cognataquiflexum nitidum]